MPKRVRTHVNPLGILKEHQFEGFGNDRDIMIDVGACKGEFVAGLAEQFPERNFLVFEIRVPLANKLREKFKDRENIVVFDGDAGRNFKNILMPCLEQEAVIKQIFINFPDPWFKEKHKKRRFLNAKFLESVHAYLDARTEFIFQTDQKFLFEETLEMLQESGLVELSFFKEPPFGLRTDWESAKIKEGSEIYRMKFTLRCPQSVSHE